MLPSSVDHPLALAEKRRVYLELQNKWPFFSRKSSLFRGNSPLSLHFQQKVQRQVIYIAIRNTMAHWTSQMVGTPFPPPSQVPALQSQEISQKHPGESSCGECLCTHRPASQQASLTGATFSSLAPQALYQITPRKSSCD